MEANSRGATEDGGDPEETTPVWRGRPPGRGVLGEDGEEESPTSEAGSSQGYGDGTPGGEAAPPTPMGEDGDPAVFSSANAFLNFSFKNAPLLMEDNLEALRAEFGSRSDSEHDDAG